jgi:hypothetical protein
MSPSLRQVISERTKAGLPQSKKKLGRHGAEVLAPRYRAEAKARAEQIAPVIRELQRDGYSMRGIAAELDKRKVEGRCSPAPIGYSERMLPCVTMSE